MATPITKEELLRLREEGAQIVDPLPPEEYEQEHILGAVNVPLRSMTRQAVAKLDRDRPVVVYCFDHD